MVNLSVYQQSKIQQQILPRTAAIGHSVIVNILKTIGRAVAAAGGSGLLARSSAVARGVNVVVFPAAANRDHFAVVEGEKLERLQARRRA